MFFRSLSNPNSSSISTNPNSITDHNQSITIPNPSIHTPTQPVLASIATSSSNENLCPIHTTSLSTDNPHHQNLSDQNEDDDCSISGGETPTQDEHDLGQFVSNASTMTAVHSLVHVPPSE